MSLDANTKGMPINAYQREAIRTDQLEDTKESIANSIANLTEEVGSLLRWYQQDIFLEKRDDLSLFSEKAPAKLGDILWYLASVAARLDVSLNEIAEANLKKIEARWPSGNESYTLYDEAYPSNEQLPRKMVFYVKELQSPRKVIFGIEAGEVFIPLGDQIDDNADTDDGYRFHDVLHLAYAAYLGWSPVLRAMLKHKRKSKPQIDVYEDGARSRDLEEALTAMVFEHAKTQDYFHGHTVVDFKIIKLAERITLNKEVSSRSPSQWRTAILGGYEVFRQVRQNKSGKITMNLTERSLIYEPLSLEISKKFFGE